MQKISILCPTKNRTKRVQQLVGSIENTVSDLDAVELILGADYDDDNVHELQAMLRNTGFVSRLRVGAHEKINGKWWNNLVPLATGDIFCPLGDDVVFEEPGWNLAVEQEFARFPDQIAMVYSDDGIQGRNLSTYPFISRRWAETVGVCPEYFEVDFIDKWIFDVAHMIDRAVYIDRVLARHVHVRGNSALDDDTYQIQAKIRNSQKWNDRLKYYDSLDADRREWANKLREVMS